MHLRSFAPEPLFALAATPEGAYVAGGGRSGAVHLWESSSGRLLRSWPAHYKARASRHCAAARFRVDTCAAAEQCHEAAASGPSASLTAIPRHCAALQAVSCLAFSDGGAALVTAGEDCQVSAWLLVDVLDSAAGADLALQQVGPPPPFPL